jgi:hypothetical protein
MIVNEFISFFYKGITKISQEVCLTHIQQPVLSSTDDQKYKGTFKSNGLKFIRSDIEKIDFIFTVNNLSNEILADDLGIEIRIFDSGKCNIKKLL